MKITSKETEELIGKLKEKYVKCARDLSPSWFNVKLFEERLAMARRNKMNIDAFILAEISNFEKVRDRFDKKNEKSTFIEQVESIINENNIRIEKYPSIDFHPDAHPEVKRMYGALNDFYEYYIPALRLIEMNSEKKRGLYELEQNLRHLAADEGRGKAKRIGDYMTMLDLPGVADIEIERNKNNYLKESSFALHDIIAFCDSLLNARDTGNENPINFSKIFMNSGKQARTEQIFKGKTGYGVLLLVKEQANCIISDFRIESFKKAE